VRLPPSRGEWFCLGAACTYDGGNGFCPANSVLGGGYGLILAGVRAGFSCARSYRALRDGAFVERFPGTSCQATSGVVPYGRRYIHRAEALIN
jgi:hypothetical protein